MAKKDAAKKQAKGGEKKDSAPKAAPSGTSEGFSAGAFAQGTREELTKVIWPTRQQLISESAAVILMVGLSATIIYLVDKLFSWTSMQIF
ncbi:MAG: preprotein translocase subunit SecE [Cyanobacteria bacterium J06631_9]